MMHDCPNCNHDHEQEAPVVVETGPDPAPIVAGDVEIARINADRDIRLARISKGIADEEAAVELAAVRAERDALMAQLAPPEPEPVVVAMDDPAPAEPETVPTPDPEPAHEPRQSKRNAWWG
jgi:hypothetical protein